MPEKATEVRPLQEAGLFINIVSKYADEKSYVCMYSIENGIAALSCDVTAYVTESYASSLPWQMEPLISRLYPTHPSHLYRQNHQKMRRGMQAIS
jgi:hypothetical protein